jgi:hypothetical protein
MNLQEIYVGGLKTGKRGIDGVEDRLTGESELVDIFLDRSELGHEVGLVRRTVGNQIEAFGKDENLVAWDVELGKKLVRQVCDQRGGKFTFSINFATICSENPFE